MRGNGKESEKDDGELHFEAVIQKPRAALLIPDEMRSMLWVAFAAAVLIILLVPRAEAVTCTVDALGNNSPDFTDLQTAIDSCRIYGDSNVTLEINGLFDVGQGGLTFPVDIQNITLVGSSATNATIQGWCYTVNPISPYPALNFFNITFDLDGALGQLFCPRLTNQNLTIIGCIFQNITAQNFTACAEPTQRIECDYFFPAPPGWIPPLFPPPNYIPPGPPYSFGIVYNISSNIPIPFNSTEYNGTALCPSLNSVFGPPLTAVCDVLSGEFGTGLGSTIRLDEYLTILSFATNYTTDTIEEIEFVGLDTDVAPPYTCTLNYTIFLSILAQYQSCWPAPTIYIIEQEACADGVYFTLINNTFNGVPNGAVSILGIRQFDVQDNNFPASGDNITSEGAFLYLQPSALSTETSFFNSNDQWRCFRCRNVRCDYAIFLDTYELKCDNGNLLCIDRQTMDANYLVNPSLCPIGNYEVYDQIQNRTISIFNDYDPSCTRYIACACSTITFQNTTSGGLLSLPMGNIVLKSGEVLPCLPVPGAATVIMPIDIVYIETAQVIIGEPFPYPQYGNVPVGIPATQHQAMTTLGNGSYILFATGMIVDPNTGRSSCNCTGVGQVSGRDPFTTPCEYIVIPSDTNITALNQSTANITNGAPPLITLTNGTTIPVPLDISTWVPSFCEEGIDYCCEPPGVVDVVYKTQCSLSPYACHPASFPNGTTIDPFSPPLYDCEYLANCSYAPGGVTGCTKFRCGLSACVNGVPYPESDPCFLALNLGFNTSYTYNSIYPLCNNLSIATNDSLCLFARSNCSQYYEGNYLLPGYVPYNPADNTTLSQICTFNPDGCLFFNDSRCVCSDCTISDCRLGVEYHANDTCSELLDLGTNDTSVFMPFAGSSLSTMTIDGVGNVIDVLLSGGFDPFGSITSISQVAGVVVSATGTFSVTTLIGGFLYDAVILGASLPDATVVNVTVVAGVVVSPVLLSTTLSGGTFSSGSFEAPYPLCNDLTYITTDPLCQFLRDGCLSFYDPATGLLLGNSSQLPTICPLIPSPALPVPLNESAFLNVTPPACEFMPSLCVDPRTSNDTRCLCSSTFNMTGFVSFEQILGSVIVSVSQSLLPPTKTPIFIAPKRLSSLNCTTGLWYGCNCPPFYPATQLITACVGPFQSNCTNLLLTVAQCLALGSNCTMPPVPANYSFVIAGVPLSCSTVDDTVHCDCNAYLAGQICNGTRYTGTVTYEIVGMPDTSSLQIIDNSACWHWNGLEYKRMNDVVVRSVTTEPQVWYDEYSLLRDTQVQNNEFIEGIDAFIVQNDFQTPYRRECGGSASNGCPSDYRAPSTVDQYQCVIDASLDEGTGIPGYGTTIFSSWYQCIQAIEQNNACKNGTVLLRKGQRPFVEPQDYASAQSTSSGLQLVFGKACSNFVFASLDGAVVVGENFGVTGDVTNITFVGINFVHPGDSNFAIFTHSNNGGFISAIQGTGLMTFYDCSFEGSGARSAGVIDMLRLYNFDMRYCSIQNFNYFAIRLLNLDRATFYDNTITNCQGDVIQMRVHFFYRFEGNTFVNCRGGVGLQGASIVFLRASYEKTCSQGRVPIPGLPGGGSESDWSSDFFNIFLDDLFHITDPQGNSQVTGSGLNTPFPFSMVSMLSNWTRTVPPNKDYACAVNRNSHIADPLAQDEFDTFITVSGGAMTPYDIADNSVYKAQYGFSFLFTNFIGNSSDQALLARMNPLVRPSLFRAVDYLAGIYPGSDFRGWGFTFGGWGFFAFLYSGNQWSCNWPCSMTVMNQFKAGNITCRVNGNYDTEVMPYYNDFAGVPRYGFNQWHNISSAVTYCKDFQVVDGLPLSYIYVTTFNGSRYYQDNVTLDRDAWIIGDTSDAGTWCTIDVKGYSPCSRGNGNTCETGRCRMSQMCWEIDESQIGLNLWQSGEPLPYDIEIYDCVFDGRMVDLHATSLAMLFSCGTQFGVNQYGVSTDVRQNPQNNALPPLSNCTFILMNSFVQNFTSFAPTPVNNRGNTIILASFPYTSGLQITCVNVLNTNTTVIIVNNTFTNIDRTAITVIQPINATITDNRLYNVSGRSNGNVAALYYQGNPSFSTQVGVSQIDLPGAINGTYPQALVMIDRNYMDQNKTILTPYDARKANLVLLVSMWIRAISDNTTLCIRNNSIRDLPIGLRVSDFVQSIMASCLTPPNAINFPDIERFLRGIADERQCALNNITRPLLHGTAPPPALLPGMYGITGTVHDIEESFADAHLELQGNVIYCDACCPPQPPPVCYIQPPGVDPLFVPTHPWWDQYIFTSMVTCLNHCNASAPRVCQVVGQSDPLGSFIFNGLPVPFKYYTEAIDLTIGPDVNINQTTANTVTLRGEPGLVICSPAPHRIDNSLGFNVLVEGLNFSHCAGPSVATWDYTSGIDNTQRITLNGNILFGNQTIARPIDGTFDYGFAFTGNYMSGYTGIYGARFVGRNCTYPTILVDLNSFVNFSGVNLEVIGYDNMIVGSGLPGGNGRYSNFFLNAGGNAGVPPAQRYVVFVNTCNDAKPGSITMSGNNIIGTPGFLSCGVPGVPLWSAYYIDPMPWNLISPWTTPGPTDTKAFHVGSNFADGTLCIGLRINDVPFDCLSADQKGFLREDIYYLGPNSGIQGQEPTTGTPLGFWLFIGPYNAFQETSALQQPEITSNKCLHCEAGCPRSGWDLFAWIVGLAVLIIIVICALCCFACPFCCFCCPRQSNGWHEDGTLGQLVPDNPSQWLTFIRYMPLFNGGRPWRPEEGAGHAAPGLNQRHARSLDESNVHSAYTGWGGAMREQERR